MTLKYRINIIWSEEDNCYLVELPDFTNSLQKYLTHGSTYGEAISNAQEVLELLVEEYGSSGKPLPAPLTLQAA